MKQIIVILIVIDFVSDFTYAQRKFFVNNDEDYSVLVNQDVSIKRGDRDMLIIMCVDKMAHLFLCVS